MALNLFSRYPGRANPASIDYPQGSFKNKTAPAATDGTLLEQDWANDTQGFLQSILSYFGVSANGQVDKVGASQYFDALTSDPTETHKGMPLVASPAETNAGENDSKIVSPKKLRLGFAFGDGWFALPSWLRGYIFQWGEISATSGVVTTHSFNIAFPNECFFVMGTDGINSGDTSVHPVTASINPSARLTKFLTLAGGAVGSPGITWFSMGR